MTEYLRACPDQVTALFAVELCTLTVQRNDRWVTSLVATALFRDGASAMIATGAQRTAAGAKVLATRSRVYPDSEEVMGWHIGSDGFRIKLSVEVATVAEKYIWLKTSANSARTTGSRLRTFRLGSVIPAVPG